MSLEKPCKPLRLCSVLFSNGAIEPADSDGCLLPDGHSGPHEFKDSNGKLWNWETDWECDCDHCMQCEGDYCTLYWRKAYREQNT